MQRRTRRPPAFLPALLLLASVALAACSAGGAAPLACQERSQCPGDAFCRAGACVQGTAPVARIAALDTVSPRANRVLAFDASGSGDPDAEDRLVAFTWRTAPIDAPCEATQVEAQDGTYRVLVPCAGAFRVELTVTDSTGMASAPAALEVRVAPDEVAPPAIQTGSAIVVDHHCGGDPLTCTPVDASGTTTLSPSATTTGGRGAVWLRWTASPPAGLTAPHTVEFSDPSSPSPVVTLRSSGAIAGDWTFTVIATDADGRSSMGRQRVTVGNRAPVATTLLAGIAMDHVYDAAGAFSAEARLPDPGFQDPDGDPVVVSYASETSGDGGHGMVLSDGKLRITVPGGEPQHLIGEGVSRRLVMLGDDGNGSVARVDTAVEVRNHAPRIATSRAGGTVPHRYDATKRVYTATATLSEYVDDDGDPILAGGAVESGSRGCATLTVAGRVLQVHCEVPITTVAALSTLAGAHLLDVTVRDPWLHSAPVAARVEVTNAAPKVAISGVPLRGTYTEDSNPTHCCVKVSYDYCAQAPAMWGPTGAALSPVVDPDGDPLDVTYERTSSLVQLSRSSATACLGGDCDLIATVAASGSTLTCQAIPDTGSLRITVTDGAASALATVPAYRTAF